MTLIETKGNLFENTDKSTIYAHCIAQDGNYGAGIAPVFIKYFGIKTRLSCELCKSVKSGENGNEGFCIMIDNTANLITKSYTHGKPTYRSIENALICLRDCMTDSGYYKLCIPKIGCGLDRLQWGRVREIIEKVFCDTNINVAVKYL
jgi:hypothetical protein